MKHLIPAIKAEWTQDASTPAQQPIQNRYLKCQVAKRLLLQLCTTRLKTLIERVG